MKKAKTVIGIIVAVVSIALVFNPGWLPGNIAGKIQELEGAHFLIENSGKVTLAHFLTLIPVICIVWLIYTIVRLILDAAGRKDVRRQTFTTMIGAILKYIAIFAAVIWGLSVLGVNTTAVLAGVGIVGIIVGFGAQSLIEDILCGFFIIAEGEYAVGDIIILDDFRGTVRKIGARTTVIEDAGGNLKVVNNSNIRNLQNRSRNLSKAICEVSVAYDTDLKALKEMLEEELPKMKDAHPDIYLDAPSFLGVEELGDSGIGLKIMVPVKEENVFAARRLLNMDVRILFAEKKVEIPFPQVVVHKGE